MVKPVEIKLPVLEPGRLAPIIGPERMRAFSELADSVRAVINSRGIYNISSTARGGGVAEMVLVLLAYVKGFEIENRWLVIEGTPEFFKTTKRIHNLLHGMPGDGGCLGETEREIYESNLTDNSKELVELVKPGDIVLLHDPQTAGLISSLKRRGTHTIWRCHIGTDKANGHLDRGWAFLRPYLEDGDLFIFSRTEYVPKWMDPSRTHIIQPSIDPFSSKNLKMEEETARSILVATGIAEGRTTGDTEFRCTDGSKGRVTRRAEMVQESPLPINAPWVVQISRWDRLKDMQGVLTAFVRHVHQPTEAHLLLAGPAVSGVSDDPEGRDMYEACVRTWNALDEHSRARVHLACLPMEDREENAAMVNAIQTHAAVITQKSLAEGFGLTVTEAMWKGKPIVASAVGGISDQIIDGLHGILVRDPTDLEEFGNAVQTLLKDPPRAAQMGANARYRAMGEFLGDRHLSQYGRLLQKLQQVT